MDYGYKITTHGRAVLAACGALEQPLRLTRAAVGSGLIAEGADLADQHELIRYVAEAAIADRRHEGDRLFLTVQYSNKDHPEVKTFPLTEFMVFCLDPETGQETDLLYATLGDYRQPVPAYNTGFPAGVWSYPVVMVVSSELQVTITASPGLATWDDLTLLIDSLAARRMDLTIPAAGWVRDGTGRYPYRLDIPVETATEAMIPGLTVLETGQDEALSCGLCPRAQTLDGVVRLFAASVPGADIPASLTLQGDASGIILGGGMSSGDYVLHAATSTRLGGVKVGSGLNVTQDGTISVNPEKVMTDEDLADEAEVAQAVADILNEGEAK